MKISMSFFLLTAVASLLLCVSCSSSSHTNVSLDPHGELTQTYTAPLPAGIEPPLWHELLAEVERASTFAPRIEAARIAELELEWLPDGSVQASWDYNNPGDYDLNGTVNLADLATIARYYGATSEMDTWPAARIADGDGNGEVNISDVTTIGAGFNNTVDAYRILASESPEAMAGSAITATEEVATAWLADAIVPAAGYLPRFSVTFPRHSSYTYYWAAPLDENINPSGTDDQGIAGERVKIETDQRGDWSMQYRDARHSNVSSLPGPQTNHLKWQLDVPGAGLSQPVYNSSGMIFIGGSEGLNAINPDGTKAWIAVTSDQVDSTPAVGPNGAVYFGCNDGSLRAVSPEGQLLWSYQGAGPIDDGVALADNGTVYAESGGGELLALSPVGELLWAYQVGSEITDTPSIGADGTVYVGSAEEGIITLNPDGTERWTEALYDFYPGSYLLSNVSPKLAQYPIYDLPIEDYSDYGLGEVILLKRLTYYSENSLSMLPVLAEEMDPWSVSTAWTEFSIQDQMLQMPTIRPDYSLLVPLNEQRLMAFDLATNELWRIEYPAGYRCAQPATLDSSDRAYLPLYHSYNSRYSWPIVRALSSSGESLWQYRLDSERFTQVVIAPEETLLVLTDSGLLCALGGVENHIPPDQPKATKATQKYGYIRVTWAPANGASTYEIFRDSQAQPYTTLQIADWDYYEYDRSILKFVDGDLETGAVHTYWIRAVNAFGVSEFSEPVAGATQLLTPTSFTASDGAFSNHVVLDWTKSQNATGYEIFRDTKYSNNPPYATVGNVSTWQDTSVTDWDEHTYWIRATNGLVSSGTVADVGCLQRGSGDTGPGDWRQFGHDSQHTRMASAAGPAVLPQVEPVVFDPYRFDSNYQSRGTVFGNQGCQYVSTYSQGIFALNPDGSHRWYQEAGLSPVVLDDGALATAGPEGLRICESDGTLRLIDAAVPCLAIALHPTGDLVISEYTAVTRYNPILGEVWSYEMPLEDGSPTWFFPAAVAADSTIFVCTSERVNPPSGGYTIPDPPSDGAAPPLVDRKLIALDPDGNKLWDYSLPGELSSAIISTDGSIVISSSSGTTYSISPLGVENWSVTLAGALALAPDDMLLLRQTSGSLYKLNPVDGSVVWEYTPPADTYLTGNLIVDSAGRIYSAQKYYDPADPYIDRAGVLAISGSGGLLWQYNTLDRSPTGLALADDGTLWLNTSAIIDSRSRTRRYAFRE